VVGSTPGPLTPSLSSLRHDLRVVIDAGLTAVGAAALVRRSFERHQLDAVFGERPLWLIAAGKAAAPMAAAFLERCGTRVMEALAVGTHQPAALPDAVEWHEASHPVPDARSVAAGRRALEMADGVRPDHTLVLLLSGGASSLLACPIDGLSLDDKQHTASTLMAAGADITALNTVRKHLSALKGGRLAARCAGRTVTLAISDVVGDDLSVIGSGPGVPDPTSWADALSMLHRYGGEERHRRVVLDTCARGTRGELPDTPPPGHPALARSSAWLAGGARDALEGAREAATRLGYHVIVRERPVTGEARNAATAWIEEVAAMAGAAARPLCVLSAGETTVCVTGRGRGGRNQEFALAAAPLIARAGSHAVLASIGTDGIDGPTDAAGACVDPSTLARAEAAGLGSPSRYLDDNNSYAFFAPLGDLVRTGRTDTNVGDMQVLLIG
jgi:glycerate 2-kinase